MPGRKRKPFVPSSWLEQNSDDEWYTTPIPSIIDRGNRRKLNIPTSASASAVTSASASASAVTSEVASLVPIVKVYIEDDNQIVSQDELQFDVQQQQQRQQQRQEHCVELIGGITEPVVDMSEDDTDINPVQDVILSRNNLIAQGQNSSPERNISQNDPNFLRTEFEGQGEGVNDGGNVIEAINIEGHMEQAQHEGEEEEEYGNDDAEEDEEDEEEEEEEEDENLHDFPGSDYQSYKEVLKELADEWIEAEIDHRVSKSASNCFWKIATTKFKKLFETKSIQGVRKKVPQFAHLRKKLYDNKVPPIHMEIAYKDNETEEIVVLEDLKKAPVGKFPPDKFTKLYEQATVKVK